MKPRADQAKPSEEQTMDATTRVDFPHAPSSAEDQSSPAPSLDLLQAIAGHDPQTSAQHLRTQALELAGVLRDKQRQLDVRESELNARVARMENELRTARLKQSHQGPPQISTATGDETVAAEATTAAAPSGPVARRGSYWPDDVSFTSPPWLGRTGPDDRSSVDLPLIETDLAHQASLAEKAFRSVSATAGPPTDKDTGPPTDAATGPPTDAATGPPTDMDAEWSVPPEMASHHADSRTEHEVPELSDEVRQEEYDHLKRQRQILREREIKLARREDQTNQLHDEVTKLHREALELRLASEQIWTELSDDFPERDHAAALAEIRAKLADHYRMANDTLARRKDDLHALRAELNLQEQRLRQQRREIQMWVDRRYDEIETRTAKLLLRERELDQLENDLERQSLEWQQQRTAFREEIERLGGDRT